MSEVSYVLSKQVVFDFLSVILAGPFLYLLGVVRSLPFSGRYFEVRDSNSVCWFEKGVESLVRFAAVLTFN